MSGQATGWVLRYGPKDRAQRAVLVVIADAANRDGEHSHPGNDAIAQGSLYSSGHVRRVVADLAESGWLVCTAHPQGGRGLAPEFCIPGVRVAPAGYEDDKPAHGARLSAEQTAETRASEDGKARILDAKGAHLALKGARPDARPTVSTTVKNNGRANGRRTPPPDDFVVDDDLRAWATKNAPDVNLPRETAKMLDHYRGKGEKRADWRATWRTWMLNAVTYAERARGRGGQRTPADIEFEMNNPHLAS